MECRTVPADRHAHTAFAELLSALACRAQTKSSLATLQVRHAHAGEQNTRKLLRWEGHGYADNRAENARLPKPVPKGRSAPHALDGWLAERNRELPQLPGTLWRTNFC